LENVTAGGMFVKQTALRGTTRVSLRFLLLENSIFQNVILVPDFAQIPITNKL